MNYFIFWTGECGNEIHEFKTKEEAEDALLEFSEEEGDQFRYKLLYLIKGDELTVKVISKVEKVEVIEC